MDPFVMPSSIERFEPSDNVMKLMERIVELNHEIVRFNMELMRCISSVAVYYPPHDKTDETKREDDLLQRHQQGI